VPPFVYWNASNPKRCLSPDAFVKLGVPDTIFDSWKTWEQGGVPELAVEILGRSDEPDPDWGAKLARYHELGVRELVSYDRKRPEGHRVRAWDRVNDDLIERVVANDRTPCLTLGMEWVIAPVQENLLGLRLADEAGRLLPVPEEAEAAARDDAEARVKVLEAELRRARLSRPT
jgi:Uma2 family endonuclease